MKKLILKPGFEFIFALSLIAILGLPPVLIAQTKKDVEIKIENGDTTVNGRNIKELSLTDRQEALQDIGHINGTMTANTNDNKNKHRRREYFSMRRDTAGHMAPGFRRQMTRESVIIKDSAGNVIAVKPGGQREIEQDYASRDRMDNRGPDNSGFRSGNAGRPFMGGMRRERKNSQNFEYTNTDKDGISTHISFRVSEATNDDLKRMPHVEGPKFEIDDLNLVPEFTSGKTLLMFNLPAKTLADVKLSDSDGKILFSEKSAGGSFSKTFALGLNGIYYLQIKQGNNIAVKRIMKEE